MLRRLDPGVGEEARRTFGTVPRQSLTWTYWLRHHADSAPDSGRVDDGHVGAMRPVPLLGLIDATVTGAVPESVHGSGDFCSPGAASTTKQPAGRG